MTEEGFSGLRSFNYRKYDTLFDIYSQTVGFGRALEDTTSIVRGATQSCSRSVMSEFHGVTHVFRFVDTMVWESSHIHEHH